MLFNSYIFILAFLPLTLLGYFGFNKFGLHNIAKVWLLLMSLVFYGYFNFQYSFIILGSIVFNFFFQWIMRKPCFGKQSTKRLIFLFGIMMNILVLGYYKYLDFIITNVNNIFMTDWPLNNVLLPLGISFFTFQQLSYLIDSYHGEVPDYSFVDYALFVSFFPQLIAGPIVTHDEIVPQFADKRKKKFCIENFAKGIYAFSIGLGKKVIVADSVGGIANWAFSNISLLDTPNAILAVLAYTFQIYFDFSGYCDMAIGIGLMFNIDITMNFNSPYKAITILDFWKRWHITLTRFFTKYIYIPLGGNRKGTVRTLINVLIVYLISGIWHGANWTFIVWGLMHGVACMLNRIFKKNIDKWHPVLSWLVTFVFVSLSWVYFRADSIASANLLLRKIFSFNFGSINPSIISTIYSESQKLILTWLGAGWSVIDTIGSYVIFLTILACFIMVLQMRNINERLINFSPTNVRGITTILLLIVSIISFSGVSTFLYFNF